MKPTAVIEPSRGLGLPDVPLLWRFRELLYFLVWRDVKVRYKQTLLGAAWGVLQPVANMLVLTLVFGVFARIPSEGFPYAVFAYTGVIAWGYLSAALAAASTSLVADQGLLTKIWFPRLVLPLASVARPAVDLGISTLAALALLAWYGIMPTWRLLALPAWALLAAATALAVGVWLSALHVRFRDVQHAVPLLLQIWMFASPVAYPISLVPESWRWLYVLNPAAQVVEGVRWSLLGKPDVIAHGLPVTVVLVLLGLVGGSIFFRRMERSFADVI